MTVEFIAVEDAAVKVDYGVTASASESEVGPKFLRITDIQNGLVSWDSVPYCECESKKAEKAKLQAGDIVFARTGATTGKSFLIRNCPEDAVFASYLIRLRLRESFDPGYVAHFFQTPHYWAQITKNARGVAQPGINATTLKSLQIPRFSLPEQKRIAEILDRAEALRRARRAALALLDELTQSIFLDMFGDPFAKNTETVPLSDLAEIVMGTSPPGNSYNELGDGIPLLNGPAEFGRVQPVEKQWTTRSVRECKEGDVLLCVRGATTGRMNRADKVYSIGRGLAAIRPLSKSKEIADVLYTILGRYYDYFQRKGTGSTFINIKKQDLEKLPIPKIRNEDSNEFAIRLQAIEKMEANCRKSDQLMNDNFAALQQRAFRGELS